jgi:glycolate oxidase iron-sulfur subunit
MRSLSDLTSQCIRCGFCLESCPTFVLSGRETESPRGRIYLARTADEGKIPWEDTRRAFDTCLGCRACEPACPSGVEYGQILEQARQRLGASPGVKKLVDGMSDHKKFKTQVALGQLWPGNRVPGFVAKSISSEKPEANLPNLPKRRDWRPLNEADLPAVKGEVFILEGCVMRVLYPDVHVALRRLLRRVGFTVRESQAECCGALHAHSGLVPDAAERASQLVKTMPGGLPIIVDSAGCGSFMKEYGLLPVDEATKFAERVFDASEFLLEHGLDQTLQLSQGVKATVTYHVACHLAHGQRVKDAPRRLLQSIPGAEFRELNESDMCCGSAGTYNLTQPSRARALLDRKWANIAATGAQILATGNPGCHAWIQQAGKEQKSEITVLHTLELLEASFSGLDYRP